MKCHQQCFSCKGSVSLLLATAQILVYRPELGQLQQTLSQGYHQGILARVNSEEFKSPLATSMDPRLLFYRVSQSKEGKVILLW